MKVVLIILFGFFVFGCNKNTKFEPTPEYLSIVGEWESIDGDNYTTIDIEKNGKINITRNDQRNKYINTSNIFFKKNLFQFNGINWSLLKCATDSDNFSSISFIINPSIDTLKVNTSNIYYNNPSVSDLSNFKRK